jgi:lipoprotein LprG
MLSGAHLHRTLTSVLALVLLATATACSGGNAQSDATPKDLLEQARQRLDDTSGLQLELSTKNLPDGVSGITAAKGVATHAPAFDGTISIVFGGADVEVPVIAVDGKVYAQIPLTVGWSDVDPSEYGAPDPAGLMSPDSGFASLLPATVGPTAGGSVRGGKDNNEILTEYTGTVPGEAMKKVIPSSSGDTFDVVYSVSADGELREARLTGVFYPDSPEMTYTVTFEDYGITQDITAP